MPSNNLRSKQKKSARRYSLGYFFKLAFFGVFRNGVMSLASVLVLTSCLIVMGSFWIITKVVNSNMELLDGYNKIVAFVDYDADTVTLNNINDRLKDFQSKGYIEEYEFVSRDTALQDEKEKYGAEYAELFENYLDENPLKDSFRITYAESYSVQDLVYNLQQISGISSIYNRVDIAKSIDDFKNAASFIFTWLTALLFVVSLFVIRNTIQASVYVRRDEISIMSCVGATGFFITFPYVIEGFIIGTLSSVMAFLGQTYIHKYVLTDVVGSYGVIEVIPFAQVKYYYLLGFLIIGVVTSVICSMSPVGKYRKV
ncbi:MAG: permease-like cell division protein FtsX [Clostridia bacterium]|nr:permease-like cell division protein FtsX [Clostridia bacterium]